MYTFIFDSQVRPSAGVISSPRPQLPSPVPASPQRHSPTPAYPWSPEHQLQRQQRRRRRPTTWSRMRGRTSVTCAAAPTSTPAPC